MLKAPEYVKRYFDIKREYDLLTNTKSSDQKIFYVLYLDGRIDATIIDKINILESTLKNYNPSENTLDARKLIQTKFKEALEEGIKDYLNYHGQLA